MTHRFKIRFMQKNYVTLFFLVILSSCRKSGTTCINCNDSCSHLKGDISGNWKMNSLRDYSAPGNLNPPWAPADPGKPVEIHFTGDSLFSYNENFTWNSYDYDRYRMIDSADFIIYSSASPTRPLFGKILGATGIELTFMGVDMGTEELFTCY